jgi:dihydrofolate reductase
MPAFRLQISMSLDGCVAGPNQSLDDPIGMGGGQLHEWVFPLAAWREMHGLEGGEKTASDSVLREANANVGATVMGRNMFGPVRGPWRDDAPWEGWWGKNPPYHHPVFVVTHHPRPPLSLEGGTTFHFVDGLEEALLRAAKTALDKDVAIAGGASVVRQALADRWISIMDLHVVPVLLGRGERIFDDTSDLRGFRLVRTIAAPGVTHYSFIRG